MLEEHSTLMREAIALSESAMEKGNEPFGALLARDGVVMLRAENTVRTGSNITNHAELNLVRMAVEQFDAEFLRGCTLYTSTEPCAMCAGSIYWSEIGRVVYGCSEKRLTALSGIGLDVPCRTVLEHGAHPVEVIGPVLEDEAVKVHESYWNTP